MNSKDIFRPEFPMVVNPDLAAIVGLDESIFLQQLHYWLGKYEYKPGHQHDGRTWIYNTAEGWNRQFKFWSEDKIGRLIRDLERRELIVTTAALNKHRYDRTKWFSLNYEQVEHLIQSQVVDITHSANLQNGSCKFTESNLQICNMEVVDLQYGSCNSAAPIPETTPETTQRVATKADPLAATLSAAPSPTQNQRREEGKAGEDKAVPLLSANIEALITSLLPPQKQGNALDTCISELSHGANPAVVCSALKRYASELAKDPSKSGGWLRDAIRGDWGKPLREAEAHEQAVQAGRSAAEAAAEVWWQSMSTADRSRIESAFYCPSASIRANPRQHRVWLHRRWQEEQSYSSSIPGSAPATATSTTIGNGGDRLSSLAHGCSDLLASWSSQPQSSHPNQH